jgi:hypothetical protein
VVERLPLVHHALASGGIDRGKAVVFARHLDGLPAEQATTICAVSSTLTTAAVLSLICSTNRQRGTAAPSYIHVIQTPTTSRMSLCVAATRQRTATHRA